MARPVNRSEPRQLTITLPAQTHAYLVKLATVGALGQTEQAIAAQLIVRVVEELIEKRRADKRL